MRPPFKCHGGKFYLKNWIIERLPANYITYVYMEPFCGAASIFFNKDPGIWWECLNDMDKGVIEILLAIKNHPDDFINDLKSVTYCESTFLKAKENTTSFHPCVREYILRRMSRGGMKKTFAWSDRLRGGKPGDINAWETSIDNIPNLSKRLKSCLILNENALDVIRVYNDTKTLFYIDPPYLPETRVSKNVYSHEMSYEQHEELAKLLNNSRAKIALSGYHSPAYDKWYSNWNVYEKEIANHASQSKTKRKMVEVLWRNY